MVMSIILAVVVAFVFATATHMLCGGRLTEEVKTRASRKIRKFAFLKKVRSDEWIQAIAIGAMVGAINYFVPRLSTALWLVPIFLLVMIALYIYLIYWWHREGSEWSEMIPFIILTILLFWTTKAAAMMTTALWDNVFWTSVFLTLPLLMVVASIGFFIIDALYFCYKEKYAVGDDDTDEVKEEKETLANRYHSLGILAIAITTFILVVILISGIKWAALSFPKVDARVARSNYSTEDSTSQSQSTDQGRVESEGSGIAFFNPSMLRDEDSSNDYNFGYNPREFNPELTTAEDFDLDMRSRIEVDPALLAANAAWLDAVVGTRYISEFYDSCENDWVKAMNLAKVKFIENSELYRATRKMFFAFLDSATKVELVEAKSGLKDQMYMNPFTVDGIPDIIVMETTNHDGWFLVYTFTIKGQEFEVAYRIECGYQPTDVAGVMRVTPTPTPTPTPTSTPEPTPTPTPTPTSTPEPTPTPTPPPDDDWWRPTPYDKDPSEGVQGDPVAPNDNYRGAGENTNTGVGAKYSSKDEDYNSDGYLRYSDYREAIRELEEINDDQKTGSDNNKPSVPSNDVTVDNNGARGTGDGGINTPTPIEPRVENDATDRPIVNGPSDPAGEWGGPPD